MREKNNVLGVPSAVECVARARTVVGSSSGVLVGVNDVQNDGRFVRALRLDVYRPIRAHNF